MNMIVNSRLLIRMIRVKHRGRTTSFQAWFKDQSKMAMLGRKEFEEKLNIFTLKFGISF